MKKTIALLFLLCLTLSVNAAEEVKPLNVTKQAEMQARMQEHKVQKEIAFERRLNLTEVQKLKAREIRKNGHEKLKPVLEQIVGKKKEAEMIRRSRMAVQMQEEKLVVIDAELSVLEKKAQSIRKSNMKEFESILTRDQKRILKEMKKEGRKRYHSAHPMYKHPVMPLHNFSK